MFESPAYVVLDDPRDLLAMVPYVLGFHPQDSIVILFIQSDQRIRACARVDIATPLSMIVDHVCEVASHAEAQAVVIVGYGPLTAAKSITAAVDAASRHVTVLCVCHVSDSSYYCLNSDCRCPAVTGVAFDPKTTAIAARSTIQGLVALPSRGDLLSLVDPDPTAQTTVSAAISGLRITTEPGPAELHRLMTYAELGQRLTDKQAARLAVLLRHRPTRDTAWRATGQRMWQRDLWLDMTRRIPDPYVTAPAALAAWCAWMRGENSLAMAAADRALSVAPDDTMTRLIVIAVRSHVPPDDLITTWGTDRW